MVPYILGAVHMMGLVKWQTHQRIHPMASVTSSLLPNAPDSSAMSGRNGLPLGQSRSCSSITPPRTRDSRCPTWSLWHHHSALSSHTGFSPGNHQTLFVFHYKGVAFNFTFLTQFYWYHIRALFHFFSNHQFELLISFYCVTANSIESFFGVHMYSELPFFVIRSSTIKRKSTRIYHRSRVTMT